jgi:hypothetical protein
MRGVAEILKRICVTLLPRLRVVDASVDMVSPIAMKMKLF